MKDVTLGTVDKILDHLGQGLDVTLVVAPGSSLHEALKIARKELAKAPDCHCGHAREDHMVDAECTECRCKGYDQNDD